MTTMITMYCITVMICTMLLISMVSTDDNITVPSFRHIVQGYNHAGVGQEVLLSCTVKNQANFSVIWKKVDRKRKLHVILAVNSDKVTEDERVSVVHTSGGEVFGLQIANVTIEDQGMFLCEVNTDPVETSFHLLTVSKVAGRGLSSGYQEIADQQFTDCCVTRNISLACQHLCSLKTIIAGSHDVQPQDCKADYEDIVYCMADGRDHLPCCMDAGIPEACTSMCQGEVQIQTDNIKTMFSCMAYTEPILACVAAGRRTLPRTPGTFSAEALTDSSIWVKWSQAKDYQHLTDNYKINVTFFRSLSPIFSVSLTRGAEAVSEPSYSVVYKLPKDKGDFIFTDLRTFSLYEVSMWAENKDGGKSLPTYAVKVITHIQGESRESFDSVLSTPDLPLPDVRSCCIQNNVSNAMCLDTFCDPRKVVNVSTDDLMLCAPWDTEMFRCLADGKDHSPCCSERRVPPLCQELCSGNELNITLEYFSCLAYMSDISGCMLESYKVLPSNPVNFRISNIHSDFVVLHWDTPEQLGGTVIDYVIKFQKLTLLLNDYEEEMSKVQENTIIFHAHAPFLLENLESDSSYEVFVEPINVHGVGEPSTRIVFRTMSNALKDLLENPPTYDPSSCCLKSGINPECSPLCSYNANISDVIRLSHTCQHHFSKIVRCSAAGRDHLQCCARRGISDSCLPLCQAVHQASTGADFGKCLPQIGQIFTCFEEGVLQLPPPIRDFKAVSVEDGMVTLSWGLDASHDELHFEQFEVFYKKMEKGEVTATLFNTNQQVNTTVPIVKISGLEVGSLYRFFVVSHNQKGSSLPSSIIKLNVSAAAWQGITISGASSPPHILSLDGRSPTGLTFSWNPPAISHPEDLLKYRLYYQDSLKPNSKLNMKETDITNLRLEDLKANTQYLVYATAITVNNEKEVESSGSENLTVWTEAAIPAFVETPTIEPADLHIGTNMTVHCIAMGTPLPTVTLYINGHLLRSEITQHMVTMVHNVTSDMGHVSCYADNGYGTPMIASRKITILRAPRLSGPILTVAVTGDTVTMLCTVVAFPAPVMAIFSDEGLEHSLGDTERVNIVGRGDEDDYSRFFLSLTIHNVSERDGGDYYCHAKNTLGQESVKMQLQLSSSTINVMQCCSSKNVSIDCLDSCRFSLDLDSLLARPHCLPQLEHILSCAQDGSDFTPCCSSAGVPDHCLGWCRGHAGKDGDVCGLTHARSIVDCFHDNLGVRPDMPGNLKVIYEEPNVAKISWKLQPSTSQAELYRVFWKPVDRKETNIVDTKEENIELTNLKSGTEYIVRVKAANSNLTSKLTKGLTFLIPEQISPEASPVTSNAQITVAVVLAALSVLGLLVLVWIIRMKKIVFIKMKDEVDTTVGFENPTFDADMEDHEDMIHIRHLTVRDWIHPDQEEHIERKGIGSG